MTNVNISAQEIAPLGGNTNGGFKLGIIDSAAKAAQNDTWTVTNASAIKFCIALDDSAGTLDENTISGNVITLANASTGATSALICYKP